MITVHPINLETAPALLILRDGRETVAVLNNRLDVETLIAALFDAGHALWPLAGAMPAAEPRPPREWACRSGDDCTCYAEGISPGGCLYYQGTW